MKGVTPVIATILLLLIAIAMVSFAFVWFNQVSTKVRNATQEKFNQDLLRDSQTLRIDSMDAAAGRFTLRGTGTQSIPINKIMLYVNGVTRTCSWSSGSLAPAATIDCNTGIACPPNAKIYVTSPGNEDESTCP